jgi:hypothetical protein
MDICHSRILQGCEHMIGLPTSLTQHQEKLLDASTLIRTVPPERMDFLHTIQCQIGLSYKNPGDDAHEWDRKQGTATLRIEAGSAIGPNGDFVHVDLPYGEKPRLVLIHLASQAVRTGNPLVDVEHTMTSFARSLGLETNGRQSIGLKDQLARLATATIRMGSWKRGGPSRSTPSLYRSSICGSQNRPINVSSGLRLFD